MGFKLRRMEVFTRVVNLTAAQVKTVHSQRVEFIPAVPGCFIFTLGAVGVKEAGPAFVLGAGGTLQARVNNTAKSLAATMLSTGFLDVATAANFWLYSGGSGGGGVALGGETDPTSFVGKSVVSGNSGNTDFTGEGSPITLMFLYQVFPMTSRGLAALTGPRGF